MNVRASLLICLVIAAPALADDGPPSSSVAALQAAHDRALVRELTDYVSKNPKADDIDQAYMALFDKVIEHDWFGDHEATARRYLTDHPDGAVAALARIVATMARAQANDFDAALERFQDLMDGLGKADQEEFAANFADSLAGAASTAGEYTVARQVYELLLKRYGDSPTLRQKVKNDLDRLDRVGKPAPALAVKDVNGVALRFGDLKGKYVLVDFWATWCAPCVAELPRLQAAHDQYHSAGLAIVGVSLDETKSALVDFIKTRNVPWRQFHNASAGGDLVEAFGVNAIPATFLIDPQGTIVRIDLRGPTLEKTLAKLLKVPVAKPAR